MAKTNEEIRTLVANSNNRQHRLLLMIYEILELLCDVIVAEGNETKAAIIARSKDLP